MSKHILLLVILCFSLSAKADGPQWKMGFYWPSSPSRLMAVLTTDDHQTFQWFMCTREAVLIKDCLDAKEIYELPIDNLNNSLQRTRDGYLYEQNDQLKWQQKWMYDHQIDLANAERHYQESDTKFQKTQSDLLEKLKDPNLSADERRFLENAKEEQESRWQKSSAELKSQIESSEKKILENQSRITEIQKRIEILENEIQAFVDLLNTPALEKYVEVKLPRIDKRDRSNEKDMDYATDFFATLNSVYGYQLWNMTPVSSSGRDTDLTKFTLSPYKVSAGRLLLRVQYFNDDINDLQTSSYHYKCFLSEKLSLAGVYGAKPELLSSYALTVRRGDKNASITTRFYLVDLKSTTPVDISPAFDLVSTEGKSYHCSSRTDYFKKTTEYSGMVRITGP